MNAEDLKPRITDVLRSADRRVEESDFRRLHSLVRWLLEGFAGLSLAMMGLGGITLGLGAQLLAGWKLGAFVAAAAVVCIGGIATLIRVLRGLRLGREHRWL